MRLLAITPPRALGLDIDAGLVEAWLDGLAAHGYLPDTLAVLLREPGASPAQILGDRRLWPLREALAARGVPTLLSLAPTCEPSQLHEQLASPALVDAPIAGLQLRGDPSPEQCAHWAAQLDASLAALTDPRHRPRLGRSAHGHRPRPCPSLDYTCLAPIHAPRTHLPGETKRPIGLEALRSWTALGAPVLALGGVSVDNARACLEAGAHGLAGIRLFFGPRAEARHNVGALARQLRLFSAASQG